jgi:hypothetical protein
VNLCVQVLGTREYFYLADPNFDFSSLGLNLVYWINYDEKRSGGMIERDATGVDDLLYRPLKLSSSFPPCEIGMRQLELSFICAFKWLISTKRVGITVPCVVSKELHSIFGSNFHQFRYCLYFSLILFFKIL